MENNLSLEEQIMITESLNSKIHLYLCYERFLRLLECVVSCFDHNICKSLIYTIVDNSINILKTKEGFFLLKALVSSVKFPYLQLKIVEKIKSIFPLLVELRYGCLMMKHIAESYCNPKFSYVKYFSRFLDPQTKKTRKVTREYDVRLMNTNALEALYAKYFEFMSCWNGKHFSEVIEYSIRNCEIFRKMILDLSNTKDKFVQLMNLEMSESILKLIYKKLKRSVNRYSFEKFKSYLHTTCLRPKLLSQLKNMIDSLEAQLTFNSLTQGDERFKHGPMRSSINMNNNPPSQHQLILIYPVYLNCQTYSGFSTGMCNSTFIIN